MNCLLSNFDVLSCDKRNISQYSLKYIELSFDLIGTTGSAIDIFFRKNWQKEKDVV